MDSIKNTLVNFYNGKTDKSTYIKIMYKEHHEKLFEYADYLPKTNIKKLKFRMGA